MANSDLNVRLGLELRNFERGLKQAERSLRRTAQSLQSIGSDLTVGITAPILAAGGASLKAAAEFEQLRNALIAVTGDAEEAQAQLNRLRKIAEAPGIGFEQAVAASLQFQGLGVSANQAEEAIKEVANAVAASGGGAQAFSGVVKQLNQIQAKNRVLQEDVNILLENAPILGKVLQDTFGAKTAEGIRAAGVNGEQFFQQLIGGLGELTRVQGSLANTFENFGISVRFALADVGQQINELFGVQSIVDGFVKEIGRAADVFRNLDNETKKSIVRFAAFAAAIGPSIFILGRLGGVISTLIGFNRALTSFLIGNVGKFAVYTGAANTAEVATKRFNLALKLTFAGIALAAVGFLVGKFLEYRSAVKASSEQLDDAGQAANAYAQAMDQGEASIAAQKAQINDLVAVAQDELKTQEERVDAIKKLQDQYPDYFGKVSTDITQTGALTAAKQTLIDALLQEARARAAANKITELAAKSIEIEGQITDKKAEQARLGKELAALGFNSLADAAKQLDANREIAASLAAQGKIIPDNIRKLAEVVGQYQNAGIEANKLQAEVISLTKAEEKLADVANKGVGIGANVATTSTVSATPTGTPDLAAQAAAQKAAAEDRQVAFSKSLREIAAGNEIIREGADLLEGSLVSALKPLQEFKSPLAGFLAEVKESVADIRIGLSAIGGSELEIVNAQIGVLKERIQAAAIAAGDGSLAVIELKQQLGDLEKIQAFEETMEGIRKKVVEVSGQLAGAFTGSLFGGEDALKSFGQAAKKVLTDLIKQLVAAVAQAALLSVVFSLFPGLGGGLKFGGILKNIVFGGFASGGTVPPGYPSDTYPALLTSGEVVVPPGKLPELGGGGGGELTGEIRLAGNDLVIALERFQNNRARTRGK